MIINREHEKKRINRIIAITMAFAMVIALLPCKSFGENKVPAIKGDSAYILSASTGEVVYEKNAKEHINPGSIVKLMTAMVLIDGIKTDEEYDNKLEITEDIAQEDGLLSVDEIINVNDFIKIMLIESSDEAAMALAKYSKGSIDEFVVAMNTKAKEMGLINTKFINPTGDSDTNQYSSAEDVALITKKAMEYPLIKTILSKKELTLRATNKNEERKLVSDFPLFKEDAQVEVNGSMRDFKYEGVYGGKTGNDRSSIALGCVNDDMDLILVIFNDDETLISDTIKLLDYGIKQVTRNAIIKGGDKLGEIRVRHGEITKLNVYAKSKGYVYLPEGASEELIHTVVVIDKNLTAPVKKGTVVGRYNIYIANELMGGVDIIVEKDVNVGWLPSYIYISNKATIIIGIVLLILLMGFSYIIILRKRNIKRRRALRAKKVREMALKTMEMEEDRKRRNWTYHK